MLNDFPFTFFSDKSHPAFPKYLNKATILGPRDQFVREGTSVVLTCEISPLIMASSESGLPKFFFPTKARVRWFHGENEVKLEVTNYNPSFCWFAPLLLRRSYVIRSHGKSPWRIFSWDSSCLIIAPMFLNVSMRLTGNSWKHATLCLIIISLFLECNAFSLNMIDVFKYVRSYLNSRICFVFSDRKRGNLRGHRLHRP